MMYNGQVRLITENEVVTMKKKLLVVCMAFTMMFSFTACGKQETTETEAATEAGVTVGAEVEQFVNRDLPSISSERDKAVRLYKAYFEKSMDSEQWLSSLENDAITSYDSYLEKLKGFEYTTAEVQNLQSQYLQSAQLQRDAIQDVIDGIKNSDVAYFDSAEEKIQQSEEALSAYKSSLRSVCESNGITINGDIGEATSTDAE
jgi:hypothetical protein